MFAKTIRFYFLNYSGTMYCRARRKSQCRDCNLANKVGAIVLLHSALELSDISFQIIRLCYHYYVALARAPHHYRSDLSLREYVL